MPVPAIDHRAVLALLFTLLAACSDEKSQEEVPTVPTTVDEDPKLAALELSTTRVHVRELGTSSGDVIIVLHGGPGDDYRYMLPLAGRAAGVSLVDDHLLVFWDQRSTGQSRRHDPDEITLEDYARDLADLIDHYSPDAPVALLGHSWGGTYATMFLNDHPDRVRAAALLEPGGLSSELRNDDNAAEQRALFDQFIEPYLGHASHLPAEAHARADRALIDIVHMVAPDDDTPVARMGALTIRELEFGALARPFDFTTHLDQVGFETLFVAGGESDALGDAQQAHQRLSFPRSRLEVISGADHNGLVGGQVDSLIPLLVQYFHE